MNKLYVIRLREVQHPIVISVCEDTFKSWIDSVHRKQISARSYMFNWQDGTCLNANYCNLMGRFIVSDAGGIEVNLCISCYRSTYCSIDEFMELFRIGKQGWCISSVVNVL